MQEELYLHKNILIAFFLLIFYKYLMFQVFIRAFIFVFKAIILLHVDDSICVPTKCNTMDFSTPITQVYKQLFLKVLHNQKEFTGEAVFPLPLQNTNAQTRSYFHPMNGSILFVIHYSTFQENLEN